MLKKMINNAQIDLEIIPIDPLLIKSGQATVGGVDMSFVRTYHHNGDEEPFIPGSSLKGMIRSYGEKICRSLRDDPVPVCLPYLDPKKTPGSGEERQFSCGLQFEKYKSEREQPVIPSPDIYRFSCPTCRLFGSLDFVGRFATADTYLSDTFRSQQGRPVFEIRDGVAIDRLTGGTAGGAKYDLEVLTRGEFSTTFNIRNFELWQMGLVALVLRDMEAGLVRIGFGKSRGLGRFEIKITAFKLTYYHRNVSNLSGIYALATERERNQYGFFLESGEGSFPLSNAKPNGLRYEYELKDIWKEAFEPAVKDFVRFIEEVKWPYELETYLKGGGNVISPS